MQHTLRQLPDNDDDNPELSSDELIAKKYYTKPAKKLRENGQCREAIQLLLEGYKEFPDNARILCSIGEVYYKKGINSGTDEEYVGVRHSLLDQAMYYFDAAAFANPESVVSLNSLGKTLVQLKRYEEAGEVYQRALTLKPDNIFSLVGISKLALKKGNEDLFLETSEHILSLSPNKTDVLYTLAWYFYHRGEYEKAEKHIKKILDNSSFDFNGSFLLARIYYAQNRLEEAKAELLGLISHNINKNSPALKEAIKTYNFWFGKK